ncbi:hypothetical protein LEP1GSC016_2193 [Leptospira borgpetersenii serovar Hardjo-bovis str. Sponselee]|uniref:Uncharacterized protein n=1 Tax=Leptospira borgpetersenii serovar Hardjo-bovis str. Sponselee TaxID=1303729 RepID=M6BZF2_LEPBO|nr:hypothetical protein LEP1GSC016_2193 [Leptospira borgpetersenii serovar Hardjo-bovis str. Sponselee]
MSPPTALESSTPNLLRIYLERSFTNEYSNSSLEFFLNSSIIFFSFVYD